MTTHHKIDAIRSGCWNGMDWEAEYTITFAFRPGERDRPYLRNGDPGYPGYPAEVEFIAIDPPAPDVGGFTDLAQKNLEQWAADWLDDHFADCAEIAESRSEQVS